MIATMLRIGWLNLKRDGLALALTFVVPIALFSVFALVFGSMDEGTQRSVRVAVLNRSASPRAEALVAGLNGMDSLEVLELTPDAPPGTAEERVRLGQVSLAVVIPPDVRRDRERPCAVAGRHVESRGAGGRAGGRAHRAPGRPLRRPAGGRPTERRAVSRGGRGRPRPGWTETLDRLLRSRHRRHVPALRRDRQERNPDRRTREWRPPAHAHLAARPGPSARGAMALPGASSARSR